MKKQLLFLVILTLSTITIFAQNVPNYVPTNGLVGWWPFSGNSNDESGNGNNGNPLYGTILSNDRFGNINNSYSFDGVDDYMSTPIIQSNINSYSISIWFKTSDAYGWMFQGSRNCSTSIGTRLIIQNGKLLYGADDAGYNDAVATINQFNDNEWHNIVGVWNGSTSSTISQYQFSIYIDGVLVNQAAQTSVGNGGIGGHRSIPINGSNSCVFGKESCNTSNYYYSGLLDDIGIWNRALTQEEITALYTGTPLCTKPTATIIPQGATTFCQGGFVNLNATTGANYTYEWYINGQVIEGATSSTYQATSTGNFTVKISDGACNTTSSPISVVVNQIPSNLVNTSGNTTFCTGGNVTLYALGTGTYKWSNGAKNQSINVAQSGNYSVTVSNNGCSSTSGNTKVTVNPNPSASITPQGSTTFCQGGFVNLVASGGTTYQWNTSSQNATINVYESGTYSVNVFNEFNCQASASQIVTVNSNPSVTLNALNNVVYKTSAPIQLVGNPSGGSYVGNGVQGSVFKPSNSSLGNKTITYNFTSQQGCSGSASRSTIVADTVGKVCSVIDTLSVLKIKVKLTTGIKAKQITAISVYPNPTSDVLVIESSDFQALGGYRYRILDVLGKEVYNALIISSKTEISLKTLGAKGTYILHIVDANNVSIHDNKIVLE